MADLAGWGGDDETGDRHGLARTRRYPAACMDARERLDIYMAIADKSRSGAETLRQTELASCLYVPVH
jgi:hypothetical protein